MAPVALVGHLRGRRARVPPGRRAEGARVHGRDRSGAAAVDRLRRAAPRPDPQEPALERVQVHARGRRDARRSATRPTGSRFSSETLRAAERVISFAVTDTGVGIPDDKLLGDLRGLPAGRRHDLAQVRRDRARPLDLAGDRAPARRRDPGRVDARAREPLLAVPAADRAARSRRSATGDGSERALPLAAANGNAGRAASSAPRRRRLGAARPRRPRRARDRSRPRARRGRCSTPSTTTGRKGDPRADVRRRRSGSRASTARRRSCSRASMPRVESVLGQLKKHPDTRHVPVVMIGDAGDPDRRAARRRRRCSSRSRSTPAQLEAALARARAAGPRPRTGASP